MLNRVFFGSLALVELLRWKDTIAGERDFGLEPRSIWLHAFVRFSIVANWQWERCAVILFNVIVVLKRYLKIFGFVREVSNFWIVFSYTLLVP